MFNSNVDIRSWYGTETQYKGERAANIGRYRLPDGKNGQTVYSTVVKTLGSGAIMLGSDSDLSNYWLWSHGQSMYL